MFISVIMPVLHETKINDFLFDLLDKRGKENVEIIVVDGDPLGSTLNLISDKTIKKISSARGRAVQQNKGAAKAKGEILLFLHADTRLPHDFARLIRQAIDSGNSGGAFDLCIDSVHPFLNWVSRVASIRSRVTRIPYGDQAIFLTRACVSLLIPISSPRLFRTRDTKALDTPSAWAMSFREVFFIFQRFNGIALPAQPIGTDKGFNYI